jgi:6,7-dimethyl-8-ribityllumazine synthase
VIRGDTPHFDYISAEASRGIGQAALDADVPIIFGVLTTDTVSQAIERAEPTKYNRGGEAAKSAIEMATVMRMIKGAHKLESEKLARSNGRTGPRNKR